MFLVRKVRGIVAKAWPGQSEGCFSVVLIGGSIIATGAYLLL